MFQESPESPEMANISRSVLWRSFFLETLWNFEKMQNLGFLFCIFPALQNLYSEDSDRDQAMRRHLELINTHPAMGPMLVGLVARLEQDVEAASVLTYRKRVMAALAAYGDRLFWNHLRPLGAVVGVVLSLCFPDSFVGIVALLAVYNVPNLSVRARGFQRGWGQGLEGLRTLTSARSQTAIRVMRRALSLGLGATVGLVLVSAAEPWHALSWNHMRLSVIVLLSTIPVCAFLFMKRETPLTLVVYPAILATVVMFTVLDI
jgi:mannose/fructose/N-acetylgalactosamine-specific phosphotransferase system component IID